MSLAADIYIYIIIIYIYYIYYISRLCLLGTPAGIAILHTSLAVAWSASSE